jgi:hypothetical protein
MTSPRGIFVLGCPRSGTTMMGRYLGSSKLVCDMGEFGGFYFSTHIARLKFERMPSKFAAQYLRELREHARTYAESVASVHDCPYFLDDTPWNLLVVPDLLELVPHAAFVLMLRGAAGVVKSLGRSFDAGYSWAGADITSRVQLWQTFYRESLLLPSEQTIAISYEGLCAAPRLWLDRLRHELAVRDIRLGELDLSIFATSHATKPASARSTLARRNGNGKTVLVPMPAQVDDELCMLTRDLTSEVEAKLEAKFGIGVRGIPGQRA